MCIRENCGGSLVLPTRGSPAAALWWRILDQLPQTPNTNPQLSPPSEQAHDYDLRRPAATRPALGAASRARPEPLKPRRAITTPEMCFGGLLPNSSGAARPPYAPHTFVAIWAGTRGAARASCSGLSRNRHRRHRALRHRRAEIQDAAETVAVQGARNREEAEMATNWTLVTG
jgi:hypothetical protein